MILIKGMEMPKTCADCRLTTWNGEDTVCPFSRVSTLNIGRQVDCPLIEVPEPSDIRPIKGFDMTRGTLDMSTRTFYLAEREEREKARCEEKIREYNEQLDRLQKEADEKRKECEAKGMSISEYFAVRPMGVFQAEPEARCCCDE